VRRGRVVSAGSPYNYIHNPTATFLGVLKVAPGDRDALVTVAGRLAELVTGGLPDGWEEELDAKAGRWKLSLYRRALGGADETISAGEEERHGAADSTDDDIPDDLRPEDVELRPDEAAELERRVAAARVDAPSLLLMGLVRSEVRIGASHLRRLLWSRPLAPADIAAAEEAIEGFDEDRALLDSAVKANDGFFTTFFVSPYSRYIARWAAHRGWTPNGVTTLSVGIGFLSAAAFAPGERWGLVLGALLLQLAFTFDCVDGQLARYTRTFTKLGAWLDSIFDRTKEYAVFAGLAIGASRTGSDVWVLAGAALGLQVLRHSIDFSFPAAQHQAMATAAQPPLEQPHDFVGTSARAAAEATAAPAPTAPPPATLKQRARNAWRRIDRSPRGVWVKKIVGFPIGERFATISLTAALFDAKVTFIVLLACGGFAVTYSIAGRIVRSLNKRGPTALPANAPVGITLEAYRDNGPLANAIGAALGAAVRLAPAALLLAAAVPLFVVIALEGAGAPWGVATAAVAWTVLLGGVAAGRPLRDRFRWAVPPLLRVIEYGGIVWLGAVAGPAPATFALLCAITFRHYDTVYRLRHRMETPPAWLGLLAAGWDGRLAIVLLLGAIGAVPAGYYAAAALLAVAFAVEVTRYWTRWSRGPVTTDYEDEEEDAE
jgi:phosphatidylglycerophosphate synthase